MKPSNKDFSFRKTSLLICLLFSSCFQDPERVEKKELKVDSFYIVGRLGMVDDSGSPATVEMPRQQLGAEQTARIKEMMNELKKSKSIGIRKDDFKISSSDYIEINGNNVSVFSCGDVVYRRQGDSFHLYEFPKLSQLIEVWMRDGSVKGTVSRLPPLAE